MVGRPVSMHAMRGISAHSNGFHTCRALHLLQLLLGAVDAPGSFRYQPPYPKPVPPPNRPGKTRKRRRHARRAAARLRARAGRPAGRRRTASRAASTTRSRGRYPLAAHGMLHTVIRNAHAGDPYRIDTLLMFMANMSWNSAMNTRETMHWLTDRDADGEYRIPHIIYSDAYASEMVAYADLVLPDTTYLERFDAISLLDRPISDADARRGCDPPPGVRSGDAARQRRSRARRARLPVGAARPRRAARAAGHGARGRLAAVPRLRRLHRAPRARARRRPARRLARRGRRAARQGHAEPAAARSATSNTAATGARRSRNMRAISRWPTAVICEWAQRFGFVGGTEPIVLQLYSETLQKFRLAAQGHGASQPPPEHRERVATYFDPLPLWYEPFESAQLEETLPRDRDAAHRSDPRSATDAPSPACGRGMGRGQGARAASLSPARHHPASDVHVPRLGFAERLAAADRDAQLAVPASRHRRAARHRRRGLGRGLLAPRQHHRTGEIRRQRAARHGVDLERDRQTQGRVEARQGCAGGRATASCSTT